MVVTAIYTTKRTSLEKYPLENLDTIRDKILLTSGDTVFDISNESMSVAPLTNFAKRTKKSELNTSFIQYGTSPKLTTTINGIDITNPDNITTTEGAITGGSKVTILPTTLKERST